MHAGLLRDRVTLQQATTVADSLGGRTTTWADLATVWAQVRTLSGREALQAQAVQSTVAGRIALRWRSDVTPHLRAWVHPSGPLYEITAVRDVDGRRRWLELDVVGV